MRAARRVRHGPGAAVDSLAMIVIVMGVTGAGKTTVGRRLAAELGWAYCDADDFHTAGNVCRLSHGVGLTDADRGPWLSALRASIDGVLDEGRSAVYGCSALRATYRQALADGRPEVRFVHLHGPEALLAERLRRRVGHSMDPGLLHSQVRTLELPAGDLRVSIALPLAAQIRVIRAALDR